MSMTTHSTYMTTALALAAKGRYTVSPNPMVGCVIVKNNEIVGQGYHVQAGGPHAEVIALQQAGANAKDATAYVTLEPCCHYGKTPPCTNALIQAGIKKIYIASLDPNPLVAGKGLNQLKQAGIEIETGLLETEATILNEIFFHFMRTQKPFVIGKWAMSLDGKTITHADDTNHISNTVSQENAHYIRQQVDAILIGAKTAMYDNPQLTVRYKAENVTTIKHPLRIILTRYGDLPTDLTVFDETLPGKTLVATTRHAKHNWIHALTEKNIDVVILPMLANENIDLNALLTVLGQKGISSLLVEGGMTVLHDFFHANLINKIHVYLAPLIIGTLPKKQPVFNIQTSNIQTDFLITGNYEGNNHV